MTPRWKRWSWAARVTVHKLSYSRAATVLGWALFIAVSLACVYLFAGYDGTTTR